jgi:hypothetical protein
MYVMKEIKRESMMRKRKNDVVRGSVDGRFLV